MEEKMRGIKNISLILVILFMSFINMHADEYRIQVFFPDLDKPLHAIDEIPLDDGGGAYSRLDLSLPHNYKEIKEKLPLVIYFSGGSGAVRGINPIQWTKPITDAGFPTFSYLEKGLPTMSMSTYKTKDTFGIELHDGETNAKNWNLMLDRMEKMYPDLPIDWHKIVLVGYSNGGRAIFAAISDYTSSPTAEEETKKLADRVIGIFAADAYSGCLSGLGVKRMVEKQAYIGLVSLVWSNYMDYVGDKFASWYGGTHTKIWDGNGELDDHGLNTFDKKLSPELRAFLNEMTGLSNIPPSPDEPPPQNPPSEDNSPANVFIIPPKNPEVGELSAFSFYASPKHLGLEFTKLSLYVKINNKTNHIKTITQNSGEIEYIFSKGGIFEFFARAFYSNGENNQTIDSKTVSVSVPEKNPSNAILKASTINASSGAIISFSISAPEFVEGKKFSKWSLYELNEKGEVKKHIRTKLNLNDIIAFTSDSKGKIPIKAIVNYNDGRKIISNVITLNIN